eukprot:jgi/Mesvir1/18238/Mv09517-RA.1
MRLLCGQEEQEVSELVLSLRENPREPRVPPVGGDGREGEVTAEYTQEEIKEDPMKFLQMTSVRSFDGAPPSLVAQVTVPDWYDEDTCVTAEEKKTRKRKKAAKLKSADAEKEAARFGLHTDESVATDSPIHAAVEKAGARQQQCVVLRFVPGHIPALL